MLVGAEAVGAADWIGLVCGAVVAAALRALALLTGFTLPRWLPEGDPPR